MLIWEVEALYIWLDVHSKGKSQFLHLHFSGVGDHTLYVSALDFSEEKVRELSVL